MIVYTIVLTIGFSLRTAHFTCYQNRYNMWDKKIQTDQVFSRMEDVYIRMLILIVIKMSGST